MSFRAVLHDRDVLTQIPYWSESEYFLEYGGQVGKLVGLSWMWKLVGSDFFVDFRLGALLDVWV